MNYLVSEPNYHQAKCCSKNLLAIKTNKTQIHMNKPVYLGLPIVELSKIFMYEFWYDYVNQNLEKKIKINCVTWIQTVPLYT